MNKRILSVIAEFVTGRFTEDQTLRTLEILGVESGLARKLINDTKRLVDQTSSIGAIEPGERMLT